MFAGFHGFGKLVVVFWFVEGRLEHQEILVAHDTTELCFANGRPSRSHRTNTPVLHVGTELRHGAVAALDEIGRP